MKFIQWLESKNISSHAVVGAIVAMSTALVSDSDVRDYFITLFQAHPKITTIVLGAAGIIFKYSVSRTTNPKPLP